MGRRAEAALVARAAQQACKSVMSQRLGTVVAHRGRVVAAACNVHTPPTLRHCFSYHAEVAALHQLRHRPPAFLQECDMYVVRLGACGHRLSKPCTECARRISRAGIGRVYYTTTNDVDVSDRAKIL